MLVDKMRRRTSAGIFGQLPETPQLYFRRLIKEAATARIHEFVAVQTNSKAAAE
jgi:hypothetical protein